MASTSKQINIQIACDEEKLEALKIFLEQKGSTIEAELTAMVEQLYKKSVPADVRIFIDARAGNPITVTKRGRRSGETQAD
jgi:hypothetical protein